MTLEDRIVRELQAERSAVPHAAPGPVPARRTWGAKLVLASASAVVVVVGVGWLLSGQMSNPADVTAAVAPTTEDEFLVDGDVVVPIEANLGTVESSGGRIEILQGAPAPPPSSDLDLSGAEQPLGRENPKWDPAVSIGHTSSAVFVGTRNGRSVFLHSTETEAWWDKLWARVRGTDVSPSICMTIGDSGSDLGGSGFCSSHPGVVGGRMHDNDAGQPLDTWWVTWVDVPDGTTVVTLSVDGEPVAWQSPVADTAFFDLTEAPAGRLDLVAVGVDGETLKAESIAPENLFG